MVQTLVERHLSRLFNVSIKLEAPQAVIRPALILLLLASALIMASAYLASAAQTIKLVVYGDSLTAGLGVGPADAFPAQLQAALRAKGANVEVINASVSGDTVSAALERFDWAIPDDADAVIVELGANDALRGVDPTQTRATFTKLLDRLTARKIPILLVGMKAPRNYGADYAAHFDPLYTELAAAYHTALYPFFLDGVALDPIYNQADGLHPTAKGVAVIVARMLPDVESLLAKAHPRQ